MALDLLLNTGLIINHDTYKLGSLEDDNNVSRVHIHCEGKNRDIWGVLSEGLSIDVKSKWTPLFGGAIGGNIGPKVLDVLDNIDQVLTGKSIRQPYFGRKYWEGTDPLKFSLNFQFVSFTNAKTDVYDPMIALLSLVYPRVDSDDTSTSAFKEYFVPGPTVFYQVSNKDANYRGTIADKGDSVDIRIGSFLHFAGCYITGVAANIENSFSSSGYPNCIKVTLNFEAMDAAFVNKNGSFMENGFEDASVNLGKLAASIESFAKKAYTGIAKTLNKGAANGEEKTINPKNSATAILEEIFKR